MAKRHSHSRNHRKRNLIAVHSVNIAPKVDIAAPICKACGVSLSARHIANKIDEELLCKACEARWHVTLSSPLGDMFSTLFLSTVCFVLSSLVVPALIVVLKWVNLPSLFPGKTTFLFLGPPLFFGGRWLANFLVAKLKLKPGTMWVECVTAFILFGGFAGSFAATQWLAPNSMHLGWALTCCVAPLALGFVLETRRWEQFATQ